jgi:hypothetical protein
MQYVPGANGYVFTIDFMIKPIYLLHEELMEQYFGTALESYESVFEKYLKNMYIEDQVAYEPKQYRTIHSHFPDLARACANFYLPPNYMGADCTPCTTVGQKNCNADCTTKNDHYDIIKYQDELVAWNHVKPINPDTWFCNHVWGANVIKVPFCGGKTSGQECSGRGICDKTTGNCQCFTGYNGNSCASTDAVQ